MNSIHVLDAHEEDINNSYDNYTTAFLTKHGELKEFVELVKLFEGFWFKWATLPKCED